MSSSSSVHALLALGLVLLASASPVDAQGVKVKTAIEGLDEVLETNARVFLTIVRQGDEALPPAQVRALHERAPKEIARALEPFGHYRPGIEARLDETGDTWRATYRVDPGPLVRVRDVQVLLEGEGGTDDSLRRVVAACPLQRGDSLLHAPYELYKLTLSSAALDRGFLDARFDSSALLVNRDESIADVVLVLATGPRYYFGATHMNQDVIDDKLLTGHVPYESGDPVSFSKLLSLQAALSSVPYFARVEVRPDRAAADGTTVPVQVDLEPGPTQRYEIGAGYGTDTGPRGRLGVEFRRINRAGHFAEGEVKISPLEISASAQYKIPTPYPRTELFTIYAGIGSLSPDWSTSTRALVGTSVSRMRGSWREVFALAYEHEDYTVADVDGTSDLLKPSANWTHTRADGASPPRAGRRLRLELDGALDGVLSSATYGRAGLDAKWIRGVTARSRLLVRATAGKTFTESIDELPPSLRYVTGGDMTVRGFGYQSLGPVNGAGQIVGGDALLTGGIETDYAILSSFALAAFLDAGNAFGPGEVDTGVGTGAGVRWMSPIGQVRLDGAFAVSEPGAPFRIHFTIGPDL